MKKIVGILAAAAVLATSVFAADISAKVQLEGSLFNFDGASKGIEAFKIEKPGAQTWNPILNVSTSGDNAGAEFCIFTGELNSGINGWQKGYNNYSSNYKIWFSPIEGLKFTIGHNAFNLNQEHICWSKSDSGIDDRGYSVAYSTNGFGIDLMFAPGWATPWMTKADGGDIEIGQTGLKVQYGADFGTINAILVAKDTFKDLKVGAAYANNFSGINFFANFLFYNNSAKDNEASKIRGEIYADGNIDAFSWAIFPVVVYDLKAETDAFDILLWAKVSYALDACTVYLQIEDAQGLLKTGTDKNLDNGAGLLIEPGITGNVGAASWDVKAKVNVHEKVDFSVPVTFSLGW